jgi:hypothetical protein
MKAAFAFLVAVALFLWLANAYSATPSDPQKAVGYVFIAFYAIIFGGLVYGALAFGSLSRRSHSQTGRAIMLGAVSALLAVIAALMVFRHPS